MKLNETLITVLKRKYPPSTMVELKFRGKDMHLKIDPDGNAVTLFIGKRTPEGKIKGERYSRRIVRGAEGEIVKDHWDLKGKA